LAARYASFIVPEYRGPVVVLDGEFQSCDEGRGSWIFDIFGLIRYDDKKKFTWYSGMSLAHHWLLGERSFSRFLNFGMKHWRAATPSVVSELWHRPTEGIVFKFPASPPSGTKGGLEFGTAKYLKHKVTYDIKLNKVLGVISPTVVGLPKDFDLETIVEVEKEGEVYKFIRSRPDKTKPNSPMVISEKSLSSPYEDVYRWICEYVDVLPQEIDLDVDMRWRNFIDNGDAAVDDDFRVELASTGCRSLRFVRDGKSIQYGWVYEARSSYFHRVLAGAFDAHFHFK